MKILYILRYWPTLTETFVYREISELQRRGYEVEVVGIDARADGVLQDSLPDVVLHRPPRGLRTLEGMAPWLRGGVPHAGLRRKDALRACWVGRLALERGVGRIHAHFAGEPAAWAAIAARVASCPFGVTVHASDLFRGPRTPDDRLVLAAAEPLVTISRYNQRYLYAQYGIASTVVRTGVVLPGDVRPTATRTGPLRVVSVGRWVPKKGLDVLLRALQITGLPGRVVADVPEPLQVSGVETGALSPRRIVDVLRDGDVFVLPCRVAADGDRDGIPVVLLEAMASGLPVVTTPVSGIPELVDESVGWLVPPDDVDALVSCLRQIAANREGAMARGIAGRNRIAEKWTLERQVDDLLAAWGVA